MISNLESFIAEVSCLGLKVAGYRLLVIISLGRSKIEAYGLYLQGEELVKIGHVIWNGLAVGLLKVFVFASF